MIINIKNWSEEFDKPNFWPDLKPIQKKGTKQFISNLLSEREKEIMKKLGKSDLSKAKAQLGLSTKRWEEM